MRRSLSRRLVIGATGLLCVIAATILLSSADVADRAGLVAVAIDNELGSGQVSEEVRVFLDGRYVGVLTVNQKSPTARLTATVTGAGRHGYRLLTRRVVKGRGVKVIRSHGDVVIDGRRDLFIVADEKGRTYLDR